MCGCKKYIERYVATAETTSPVKSHAAKIFVGLMPIGSIDRALDKVQSMLAECYNPAALSIRHSSHNSIAKKNDSAFIGFCMLQA